MILKLPLFLYLQSEGRIDRKTYLLGWLPLLAVGAVNHAIFPLDRPDWYFLDFFLAVAALVMGLKRSADLGRPAWLQFAALMPIFWILVCREAEVPNPDQLIWIGYVGLILTALVILEMVLVGSRDVEVKEPEKTDIPTAIDDFVDVIGRAVAWLCAVQVIVVANNVAFRYFFRIGHVSLQEVEWHLISPIALLGMVYALRWGDHVKVDIFYDNFSPRFKNLMDAVSALILIVIAMILAELSREFVFQAYKFNEGSPDAGGLPHRWLLRAFIPIGFMLMALQAFGMLMRTDWQAIVGRRSPSGAEA